MQFLNLVMLKMYTKEVVAVLIALSGLGGLAINDQQISMITSVVGIQNLLENRSFKYLYVCTSL